MALKTHSTVTAGDFHNREPDKHYRLEALRLACGNGGDPDAIAKRAEVYYQFLIGESERVP